MFFVLCKLLPIILYTKHRLKGRVRRHQMRLNIDKTKAEVEKMELGDVAPVYIVDDIGDDDD
ncbi:hypothetical protein FXF70_10625 [Bacillus sp. Y3]|nr:hypothetical protein FXF70_10625 [Bacillus sp. Y3]